jgi:succinoglycan biosynthesis transport protein ExoP
VDLRDYLGLMRRRGWLIVVGTCLGLLGAHVVNRSLTPTYRAETTVFLGPTRITSRADQFGVENGLLAQSLARSYIHVATSRTLLRLAANRLGSPIDPRHVSAAVVPDTQILRIAAKSSNPRRAAAEANAVTATLVAWINGPRRHPEATLTVIDPAGPPARPVEPKRGLDLALGGLVGLLLGYAAALARERLDTRIRDRSQLQGNDMPLLLGEVPKLSRSDRKKGALRRNEHLPNAEPWQRVAGLVAHLCRNDQHRALVITSPVRGDGKTLLSAQLAVTLASDGLRVALVEADFRAPGLARQFRNGGPGIVGALRDGQAPRGRRLTPTLSLFPAGSAAGKDAHRLLTSEPFGRLLASLRKKFDLVLIDSPPVLAAADAGAICAQADAVLLVARRGETTVEELLEARSSLGRLDIPVIGSILNAAALPKSRYGYGR